MMPALVTQHGHLLRGQTEDPIALRADPRLTWGRRLKFVGQAPSGQATETGSFSETGSSLVAPV